jgi:hypothetical protein
MTNSRHNLLGNDLVDSVMDLLCEERIAREVDDPLDQAAGSFQLEIKLPLSHSEFNRVIAEFVRHLYLKGLRLSRDLSYEEAMSEAVFILERYYQGGYTSGYDGALLDGASTALEGIEFVLSRITASVKAIERQKYTHWVFVDKVDRLDWETRCRFVSTYLERFQDILPPQLREMDPARLVDHVHELIFNHISSDNFLKSVFAMD